MHPPPFLVVSVNRRDFKPGEKASKGVFWVHHYAHRVTHLVTIDGGTFPKCKKCGDRVRFESALRPDGELVWNDPDFGDKAS
jgi:hypothetical protein